MNKNFHKILVNEWALYMIKKNNKRSRYPFP